MTALVLFLVGIMCLAASAGLVIRDATLERARHAQMMARDVGQARALAALGSMIQNRLRDLRQERDVALARLVAMKEQEIGKTRVLAALRAVLPAKR